MTSVVCKGGSTVGMKTVGAFRHHLQTSVHDQAMNYLELN